MSIIRNVRYTKCPLYEMSVIRNVRYTNCPYTKCPYTKCPPIIEYTALKCIINQ